MMIRIACAGAVLAFSVLSAHGQVGKVMLKGAEELGSSPAARELLAGAARQSGLAKLVLEALGFNVKSEATAVTQLRSLSSINFGKALLKRSELDAALQHGELDAAKKLNSESLPHFAEPSDGEPPNPSLTCGALCRAAVQDYGKYTLGATGTVPLSVYVDALVQKQTGR